MSGPTVPDDQFPYPTLDQQIVTLKLPPETREADRILNGSPAPSEGWTQEGLLEASRMHWSRVTAGFNPSPMEAPNLSRPREESVTWRLSCPSCSAKMALFGVPKRPKRFGDDYVWIHVYRRVTLDYHGVYESYSEGQYEGFRQVRLTCGTPRCSGFEKYRIETIVRWMHGLRDLHPAGTLVRAPLGSG